VGLNLKEMILANPPRIVLDVMSPAKTAAASKPAPKPAPKPAAKPVAKAPAPAPAASKPAPKPVQTARAESSEPRPARAATEPSAAGPDATGEQPAGSADALASAEAADADDATVPGKPVDAAAPDAKAPGDDLASAPVGEPSEGGVATMGLDMAKGAEKPPPPPPAAERVAKRTLPPAPARVADEDTGMGMGTIGMAIVGLVVLGGGFVLWRRRRGDAGDDGDDEGVELGGGADDNPFAGIGVRDDSPLSAGAAAGAASEFDLGGIEEEEKEAAPVDAPLAARSDRAFSEADALIQTMAQEGGGVAAGLASDDENEGDEEIMRMIREFERRIASLESRLDEVVDARERLERQVAAQTEELRVQRAAIARTQRAVRNLNRSDEEGPTEPAIREPQ
jgi:LPXTG-motif cell wall-anchored protein